jgi:hypothetical protein
MRSPADYVRRAGLFLCLLMACSSVSSQFKGPIKCSDFGNFVSAANDEADFVIASCIERNNDGSRPWFVLHKTSDGRIPWSVAIRQCENTSVSSRNRIWRNDGCKRKS